VATAAEARGEHHAVLAAFRKALRQETHNLARRPDLLWQQSHSRLQWSAEACTGVANALEAELPLRPAPGARPWLRRVNRYRESEAFVRVFEGHSRAVRCCAVSPDGTRMASGGDDHSVRVWDMRRTAIPTVLEGHADSVTACAFSPDGRFVASAAADSTLRLWDAATERELVTLHGHDGRVNACGFSPDGTRLVSGGEDGTVRVWRTDGAQAALFSEHQGAVTFCAFTADGEAIVSAGRDNTWKVRPAAGGELLRDVQVEDPESLIGVDMWVHRCALSSDGTEIATVDACESTEWGSTELKVRRWDIRSGEQLESVKSKTIVRDTIMHPVTSVALAYSPRGELAYALDDSSIAGLAGHAGPVTACAFSPDGGRLVTASEDRTLRLWDWSGATEPPAAASPKGHTGEVTCCDVSPDGSYLLTGGDDWHAYLWEARSGAPIRDVGDHTGPVYACRLTGSEAVTACPWYDPYLDEYRTFYLNAFALESGERTPWGFDVTSDISRCAISWDGRRAIGAGGSADVGYGLLLFQRPAEAEDDDDDDDDREPVTLLAMGEEAHVVATGFTAGDEAVACSTTGGMHVLRMPDLAERRDFPVTGPAGCVVWFARTANLVLVCAAGGWTVWDHERGTRVCELAGASFPRCARFSDDGALLATGAGRGFALWDTLTGAALGEYLAGGDVTACAIAPGGDLVYACDSSGDVAVLRPVAASLRAVEAKPSAADAGAGAHRCPHCGATASPDDAWCPKCGHDL
jgi:WD40 repeat protein